MLKYGHARAQESLLHSQEIYNVGRPFLAHHNTQHNLSLSTPIDQNKWFYVNNNFYVTCDVIVTDFTIIIGLLLIIYFYPLPYLQSLW